MVKISLPIILLACIFDFNSLAIATHAPTNAHESSIFLSLRIHQSEINGSRKAALNAEGSQIAIADQYGYLRILDTANGQEIMSWKAHDLRGGVFEYGGIDNIVFDTESRRLATSAYGEVKVWDAHDGSLLYFFHDDNDKDSSNDAEASTSAFNFHTQEFSAFFNKNGTHKIYDAKNGYINGTTTCIEIKVLNTFDGEIKYFFKYDGHSTKPNLRSSHIAFGPGSSTLHAFFNSIGDHNIYDLNTRKTKSLKSKLFPRGNLQEVSTIDSRLLARYDNGQEHITMLDAHENVLYKLTNHRVRSFPFSPDGALLVASKDNETIVYDANNGNLLCALEADYKEALFDYYQNNIFVIGISAQRTNVNIWSIHTGSLMHTCAAPPKERFTFASLNSDATRAITIADNERSYQTLTVWLLVPDELLRPEGSMQTSYVRHLASYLRSIDNKPTSNEAFIAYIAAFMEDQNAWQFAEDGFKSFTSATQDYLKLLLPR